MVDQYNNAVHSSIKMMLVEASKNVNQNRVRLNLHGDYTTGPSLKYSVGDKVRITRRP